jgi:hypothetical protein
MVGIAWIGLLLPDCPCTNLGCVANQEFVFLLGQHPLEPVRMPGGFHTHAGAARKCLIKLPHPT